MSEEQIRMPPEIAKAIVAVMKQVKRLAKDGRNEHGRYNFTSVDAFYEAVGPLCAEAGIFFGPREMEREIIPPKEPGKAGTLRILYEILLFHEGGECFSLGEREVMVTASGPQAYASALSFVSKYAMRNLFQIPTGDADDADLQEKTPLPANRSVARGRRGGQPGAEDKIRAFIAEANAFLDTEPDPEELLKWEGENSEKLKRLREAYGGREDVQALKARIEGAYRVVGDDSKESEQG